MGWRRGRMAALVVLAVATVAPCGSDFTTSCPAACQCMWVSGKRQASCVDIGLSAVPRGLSDDIQVLNLSGTDIERLPERAFASVGLEHLQKLYLRRSSLTHIDKDAFAGLRLLIQLDLSHNAITELHVDTFRENEKLRLLLLSGNPLRHLTAFQFAPLPYLQRLDLAECQLTSISPQSFGNLAGLEKLNLNNNRLSVLDSDAFQSLANLKWLTLHGNPWHCDCHLRLLRDWLLERGLYQADTQCAEPERLVRKSWSDTRSAEFACRPQISIPEPTVAVEVGRNVSLRCQITGNPPADTNWVMSGRIVANNTRIPFTGQTYTIHVNGTVNRRTSLTVTNVNSQDAGQYLCVGVNPAGVVERNVTLVVTGGGGAPPTAPGSQPPPTSRLSRSMLLGLVIGAVALLLLLLLSVCCCCWRRCRGRPSKLTAGAQQSRDTLLGAAQTPQRLSDYEKVPQTDIEMERGRPPAALTLPRRPATAVSEEDPRSRRYSLPDSPMTWDGRRRGDYPDLLHLPRRAGRSSPAGSSSSSTQPDQSRLLPTGPPRLPLVSPARGARPGYVTLPRRQRTPSWGNGRAPEPVYDTLGPRTTADGSSRLSLASCGPETLPPYYVALDGEPRSAGRSHNASADLIEPLREEPEEWDETPPTAQPPPPQRPRKATPPVAPKPKKATPAVMPKPHLNGTHVIAFQDEGDDGTEV